MARYTLLQRAGTGGLAEVWRASRESEDGTAICAVKRLLPEHAENAELRRRLMDEYAIGTRLRHPHIVEVFELFDQDGVLNLAMEYIDGISVERLIVRGLSGHFVPIGVAGAIVAAVFDALRYAHTQGVLHRDVSAANVLVSDTGHIKLSDFGIAHAADRLSSTAPGVVIGKDGYLSEARLLGAPAIAADDLFTLGIILERLLAAADPRERSTTEASTVHELRRLLGSALNQRETIVERTAEALGRLERSTRSDVSVFLRTPSSAARSRAATPASQRLDGTTVESDASAVDGVRHQQPRRR